ncbi:winged helix-turn-helix transcriptional regulator [Nocardia sp. CDC160]|uniref:winged helix-turn-helix transcriptional regulator n=1 Tax=Nocardia sp. CDC160 TaxID=3112166 RepID=UPI002DB69974|nr:helix-turn-helix domain-containing protein [Nocardia sp. CDC160]MEC3915102.1 helix-turn-helix domain-containing protein [Nocardia sp. CDC160]
MDDGTGRIEPIDPLRSPCPVAATLDVLGDRWTMLVIRDMFAGKRRYTEFLASPERITTNILADRLRRLERVGIVYTATYQDNPPRREYLLTDSGKQLRPVLAALARWGTAHIPGTVDTATALTTLRQTRDAETG